MQPLNEPKFPRLSRPVPLMRPEYDVVVVGSGYGGAVAASRMARAGKSVAILELGRERWPGEYPSDLKAVAPELHVSGHGKFSGMGKPTGLFHLIVGEGQNALVGNGLGGTSLINANIFLEADKRTLQLSNWPTEIRKDPDCLHPYYSRAADMLQPTPYPSHLPTPNKLDVLEKQAALLGFQRNFYRPPQTTFFHNGLNNAGVEMHASTGSGQDCTGVNDGSKNSVLMNYLPDAWNWGAEIFCECEVRYVRKDPEGYTVFFAWHEEGRGAFKEDFYNSLMWVKARELCFLGAGSLGTTEILLRSKARGLRMSRFVGHKISGNGDMLAFGYNTNSIVNGVGTEGPRAGGACGPCITGIIDNRGPDVAPNVLNGYVIQEGAVPQALAPLLQTLLEGLAIPRSLSSLQSRVMGPYAKSGSVQRTQTYLVMTHDNGEGLITMDGDKPRLQFLNVGRREHVANLTEVLENATRLIGGKLIASPFYNASSEREGITVHPLGGAIMSSDGTGRNGGTNHLGQLFTGQGEEVHEGLVCVDASVIPTSLGVNPFATITALAERSVDYIAEQRGLVIDWSRNGRLDLFGQPTKVFSGKEDDSTVVPDEEGADGEGDLRFTEIMEGHVHIGSDIDDFVLAEKAGKGSASAMKVYLSVEGPNVDKSECPDPVQCFAEELEDGWTAIEDDFSVAMDSVSPKEEWTVIDSVDHECSASGTVSCGALSRDPLLILRGKVRFFSVDEEVSHGTNLVYELALRSTDGETYLLKGRKNVDSSMAFSVAGVWRATTTVDTTLFKSDGYTVVGRGRIYVSMSNFMSQITTLRTGGIVPAYNFLSFFTRNLASFFFAPLAPLQYPDPRHTGYKFKIPPRESITLIARDGVRTPMKVWVPPESCMQRREFPLLLVPGASVDESIYALPTAEQNAVEYFTERGYTVYVPTMRWGRTPAAMKGDTPFDARLDVEAAMRYVREHQPGKKILVICHCVGAIATSCGLLDGTIPGDWIQGVLASQIFFKQHFGRVNRIKGHTMFLPNLYRTLAGPWYPITSTPGGPTVVQFVVDQLLRFYPVGKSSERCGSTVCHRCHLIFGRLWNHGNLTSATHAHLCNFFGGIHMDMLMHLIRTGNAQRDINNELQDLLTPENVERMRGIKMTFFSGGDNIVFTPKSTMMCYEFMRDRFGDGLYRRFVVNGYGHLDPWIGKNSHIDVYPIVQEHLDWFEERTQN